MKNIIARSTKPTLFSAVAILWACCGPALWADVITVTQTGSGEAGTLRWAIKQANRNPGPDVIQFDLAPSMKDSDTGTFVITGEDLDGSPLPLPEITDTVEINGLSQNGSMLGDDGMPRTLLIELTRNPLKFRTGSDGSKVLGLVINDSADSAISIRISGYHTIAYNSIGTDSTGTSARGSMKQMPTDKQSPLNNQVSQDDVIVWLAYEEDQSLLNQ